jgi:phosphoenolpyruvate-protein phosphotransferase (PTS system enzyme I)
MDVSEERKTIVLNGIGVSPGIVIGKAHIFKPLDASSISHYHVKNKLMIRREISRFKKALKESEAQLLDIKRKIQDTEGIEPLYIIDVHIMILKDRLLIKRTIQNIENHSINAEWALKMTIEKYRDIFNKSDDEYLKERISDVEYVGQRILRNLFGVHHDSLSGIGENSIIIARDLSPADTVHMKFEKVLGFATDIGGKTSHTAIVARSYEIPAVVGLENVTSLVRPQEGVIIDGTAGVIIINPDREILKRYEDKKSQYKDIEDVLLKHAHLSAVTKDKQRIEIGANIEFLEEIPSAVIHGAEGIGLYRTEFLYINKESLPTEEEHFSNYKQVVEGEGIKWATIRTFDLGGDKFISDPKVAKEMNPVMGLRAIRFCLKEVELFKVQLRAILRASAYGKIKVLFPMISGIEELRAAKRIFNEVRNELIMKEMPVGRDIKIGIMMEVPSAVMVAESLASEVDFFSIGTNDLIQYALAIDRVNERVSYLYEPLHPAVLRLIKKIVEAGRNAGIEISMCGEMAGEPLYTMILLGLGLNELSMNAVAIPRVKKIIRASTIMDCKKLLKKVLTFTTAHEIEAYVQSYMTKKFPEEFSEEVS